MDTFLQQVRIAARSLIRARGFSVTAVVTLGLGIGLSTAVFTVADAILIRRLPIGDQDRMVVLSAETRAQSAIPIPVSYARDFALQSRSLQSVAYFAYSGTTPKPIRDGDRVYRLERALVSGNFFDVLKSPPAFGRALREADNLRGAADVLVLSHRAWAERFGGDSAIIGRTLVMHETGRAYMIVGVMGQGLDFPRGADFWAPFIPASTTPGSDSISRVGNEVRLVGRLKAGASVTDAHADLATFLGQQRAGWAGLRGVALSLPTVVLGDTKPAVLIFGAAAGLLLLLTCINVANLLLVRGLGRVREIVVRSALGAERRRIVWQLLTESALLAAAGGVFGVAIATLAVRGFVAVAPAGVPRLDEIRVSGLVLVVAMAITTIAMLLFALGPALITSRVALQDVLRSGTRQIGDTARMRLGTESLVAGQIALAVMVLCAAGLIGKSLMKLERVDLALEPKHVFIAELALDAGRSGAPVEQRVLLDVLLTRVSALPQVVAVSPTFTPPFTPHGHGGIFGQLTTPDQSPEDAATNPLVNFEVVAPNYFSTLGIPLRQGRDFSDDDRAGSMPVLIISESVARRYWPGVNPIGKSFKGAAGGLTVVGVVPDTRYSDLRTPQAAVYFSLRQAFFPLVPMTLVIRTTAASAGFVAALRTAIAGADPRVALVSATPFETLMEQPRAQPRMNAVLLAVFATAALGLAAIGLFGVIATMVRQRTREIGIRMALGATQTRVRHMVLGRGLSIAAAGAAAGIAGALLTSRWLADLLFEVKPTDAATLGSVAVVIVAVALLASVIPARASMRIEPAIALRSDD